MDNRSSKKRKIAELCINDKFELKRRKIEQKRKENEALEKKLEEDSDLSENDEPLDYSNIEDFLAPQEKELLRKDPHNLNYLATTWTNETTLLKGRSEFKKWLNFSSKFASHFPRELYQEIINHCDANTLFKWRRVCKLTNALVLQSHHVWRELFYNSRHWKQRHDIENQFTGIDPKHEDRSEWKNVIPDDQIDWFGEYRRNHVNSVFIRKVIEDIKMKLQKIVDDYGVVKQGVASPAFFEPGLTDEEIDTDCSLYDLPLTNDVRELIKCCNGARFRLLPNYRHDEADSVPYVQFPTLEYISYGPTITKYEKIDYYLGGYCNDDLEQPLATTFDPEIQNDRTPIELDSSDMASDSDEYIVSDQSTSLDEEDNEPIEKQEHEDEDEDPDDYDILKWTYKFQSSFGGNDDEDYHPKQLYKIHDGAVITDDRDAAYRYTVYESLVAYLQEISDLLDDNLAVFWLQFNDYTVIDKEECEFDEFQDIIAYENNRTLNAWTRVIYSELYHHKTDIYITPRAIKLLIAAAQDIAVQVFKQAQSLETSEELQPETLLHVVKESFPECTRKNEAPRTTTNSQRIRTKERSGLVFCNESTIW